MDVVSAVQTIAELVVIIKNQVDLVQENKKEAKELLEVVEEVNKVVDSAKDALQAVERGPLENILGKLNVIVNYLKALNGYHNRRERVRHFFRAEDISKRMSGYKDDLTMYVAQVTLQVSESHSKADSARHLQVIDKLDSIEDKVVQIVQSMSLANKRKVRLQLAQDHFELDFKQLDKKDIKFSGKFSEVWIAERFGERVAVKEFKSTLDGDAISEIKREIEVACMLRSNTSPAAIIMELMHTSLYARLDKSTPVLLPSKIYKMAQDIALGLSCLHCHNPLILHRGLKSENVLLDREGNCKLTDFGLARIKERSSVGASLYGKSGEYSWTAPECLINPGQFTEESDIYALGVIFCELGTKGIRPFEGISDQEVSERIQRGQIEILNTEETGLDEKYVDLANQCRALKPEDRPILSRIIAVLKVLVPPSQDDNINQ